MEKVKELIKTNKKIVFGGCAIILLLLVLMVVFINQKDTIEIKQEVFKHEVNTELEKDVNLYLEGVKDVEEVTLNFDDVDIKKLGDYDGIAKHKNDEYIIKFQIVDTTKPVIEISKENFVFNLEMDLEEINESINQEIKISDNYDTDFATLRIIDVMPEEETELEVMLSVKDMSGNESNELILSLQFTEDGEEKEGLKKEEIKRDMNSTAKGNSSTSNTKPSIPSTPKPQEPIETPNEDENESNTPDNGNSNTSKPEPTPEPTPTPKPEPTPTPTPKPEPTPTPTPKPEPTPTPTPKPEPTPEPTPTPKPEEPSKPSLPPLPSGAVEMGLFPTKQDGISACHKLTDDINSAYYDWLTTGIKLSDGTWYFYISN